MSIKLILGILAVLAICIYVFKKTVSNDAENDYRLRDILANAKDEDLEQEKPTLNLKSSYNEKALEENVYEELEKSKNQKTVSLLEQDESAQHTTQTNQTYSTTTHETYSYKQQTNNQKVYYEKINDDACENYSEKEEIPTYNQNDEDTFSQLQKSIPTKKSMGLLDYIKTFWRGVTFTVGAILFVCSIYGLMNLTQTPEDAIKYSIWLLAGIILVK